MSRLARAFGLNTLLVVLACLVLALAWQLARRIQTDASVSQPLASVADTYPFAGDIYQVEIRNGAGVEGLAQVLREYLIAKGYDVVEVGNHTDFDVEETTVVDRVGNLDIARQVTATLGLEESRIRQEDEAGESFLDASIIIGKDYPALPPFIVVQEQQP